MSVESVSDFNVDGVLTCSKPALHADGTVATPGVSFATEVSSGLYRAGAKDVGLSCFGSDFIRLNNSGTNPTVNLLGTANDAQTSINAQYTAADAGAGTYYGLRHVMSWRPTTNALGSDVTSLRGTLTALDTSATAAMTGTYVGTYGRGLASNPTRAITSLAGLVGEVGSSSNTATAAVTNMYAIWSRTSQSIYNAVTSYYGARIDAPVLAGGGAITTTYGLYIANQNVGGTKWALYSAGGNSSHAGSLRVGDNTAPSYALDVTGDHNTSGLYRVGGTQIAASNLSNGVTGTGTVVLSASPTLTGTPSGPTASPGTNTTQFATTSFVATSFAPLASPALTGTPTVPTAAPGTNTTQAASCAFVLANASTYTTARMTADIVATGSMQNATGLSFAIAAGEVWAFEAVVFVAGGSSGTTFAVQVTGPASPTLVELAAFSGTASSGATAFSSSMGTTFATSTTSATRISGTIVNGANAGTIQIQFSSGASSEPTVKAGSRLMAWKT